MQIISVNHITHIDLNMWVETSTNRTHARGMTGKHLTTVSPVLTIDSDLPVSKLKNSNMKKSSKLLKLTDFHQNNFLTCYLIINFGSTFFLTFQKIIAYSISPNVKTQVAQKCAISVVKQLRVIVDGLSGARRYVK